MTSQTPLREAFPEQNNKIGILPDRPSSFKIRFLKSFRSIPDIDLSVPASIFNRIFTPQICVLRHKFVWIDGDVRLGFGNSRDMYLRMAIRNGL